MFILDIAKVIEGLINASFGCSTDYKSIVLVREGEDSPDVIGLPDIIWNRIIIEDQGNDRYIATYVNKKDEPLHAVLIDLKSVG